ncbi:hypothetical protein [Hydrogenophaga pseudoflava]|uniref:Uncharacterized protein n=1 Tax=Hydrogenophaga pseudoflava TaxID=47421 RepID=A0A4P6X0W5_HYDPS|nr:hypothetical protein [Hydrogenophaga pseudoflava]QBM28365.1 hypothetical protein HPF_11750 [Hydrogenophaga pseudoflava]
MSQLSQGNRRSLYAIFLAWLSQASTKETDQLDELLDKHPPQGARSVLTLVSNCLDDPVLRPQLPKNLALRLQAVNWLQGGFAVRAV